VGWIVVLIIIILILISIWLARKKEPKRASTYSTTVTQAPPKTESRPKKTKELLKLGYEQKLRLTIKYETRNPVPREPAIKVRDVDIYGFGEEYFEAFCHYRNEIRTFKISRVLSARLCNQTYQIPQDYLPSGWVTEGRGELHNTTVEKPVQVISPDVSISPSFKDIGSKQNQEGRQRASSGTTKYESRSEFAKTYVRYDWQKLFEESIKTPFPDEWSPALPYLYEAYKLEKEGGDQQKVQEMLEKAREADGDATSFYIGRRSIMKKTDIDHKS
jgi:hypothetical protein